MGNDDSKLQDDPPALSPATSTPSSLPQDSLSLATNGNEGTKRKEMSSSTVLPKSKREKTVIDDPGAVAFFKKLHLPKTFLTEGKCHARQLQSTDEDFNRILKYVENSQELAFGVKVLTILRITPRANEAPEDFKNSNDPEIKGKHRKMLFHGTKANNIQNALEKGLRLPQTMCTGILFADRVAYGCLYADEGDSNDKEGKHGYLFICDVLLGNMNTANEYSFMSARAAPPMEIENSDGTKQLVPCQSILNLGQRIPDPNGKAEVDGCEWPLGTTINNWNRFNSFNQYIIYDAKQVQPKFLIKVEFTEAPYHPKLD